MSGLELLLPFLPIIAGSVRGAQIGSARWDQSKANGRAVCELVSALQLTLIQLEDGLTTHTRGTNGMKLAVDSLVNLSRDAQIFVEQFAKKGFLTQSSPEAYKTIMELRDRHNTVQNHIIIAFGLAAQSQSKAAQLTQNAKSQAERPYLLAITAPFDATRAILGAGTFLLEASKGVVGTCHTLLGQVGIVTQPPSTAERALTRRYGTFTWQGPQTNTIAAVRYYSHAIDVAPTNAVYHFRLGTSSCWMCIRPDLFEEGPNGESPRDTNVLQEYFMAVVRAVEQAHRVQPNNPEYHQAFIATQQELRRFEDRRSRMKQPSFFRDKSRYRQVL